MASRLYPCNSNRELMEKLAWVSEGTYSQMEGIQAHVSLREDERLCYHPREGEYTVGKVVVPATEDHPEVRACTMEAPDGTILFGHDTDYGSGPDDASYLIWAWKHDDYPEVHDLENFIMSGWGRVHFPEHWENRMVRFDDEFIGPVICGEYYGGGTDDPELIRELLHHMDTPLPEGVSIEDLHGVFWG
jgi:hypothetical protein